MTHRAMTSGDKPLYVITGPTASGKTAKAVALARRIGGEIVSADSRQLYRGMDIGTGKDLDEYGDVPYHMIDICDAGYKYNLFEYLRDCKAALGDIAARGRGAVWWHRTVCGKCAQGHRTAACARKCRVEAVA